MLVSRRRRDADESVSIIESDRNIITLRTAHDAFPAAKLKTDNLQDGAKTWGQRRDHSRIVASVPAEALSPGETRQLDFVAVLGLNRKMPTTIPPVADYEAFPNQARCIVDYFDEAHFPPVIITGFSSTNITPSYGNPDNSDNTDWKVLNQVLNPPDELLVGGYTPSQLRPTNPALDTEITFRAGGYTLRPLTGAQEILIHVSDSVDPLEYPTIITKVRQGGIDLATLVHDFVERTSHGYIYKYAWSASILSSTSSAVEFRITGKKTASSSVSFMGFSWRAGVSGTLYDSGFIRVDRDFKVWCPQLTIADEGELKITVEFSDWISRSPAVIADPVGGGFVGIFISTPLAGPLQIGRYLSGAGYELPLLAGNGFNPRKSGNNQGALVQSYGGHQRAIRNDLTRTEADFNIVPQSQRRFFTGNDPVDSPVAKEISIEQFFQEVGFVLPLLFIPDTTNPDTSLWATITGLDVPDLGRLIGDDTSGSSITEDERFNIRLSVSELCAHTTARS